MTPVTNPDQTRAPIGVRNRLPLPIKTPPPTIHPPNVRLPIESVPIVAGQVVHPLTHPNMQAGQLANASAAAHPTASPSLVQQITNALDAEMAQVPSSQQGMSEAQFDFGVFQRLTAGGMSSDHATAVESYLESHNYGGSSGFIGQGGGIAGNLAQFDAWNATQWAPAIAAAIGGTPASKPTPKPPKPTKSTSKPTTKPTTKPPATTPATPDPTSTVVNGLIGAATNTGVPGSGSVAGGVGVADGTTPLVATPTTSSSNLLAIGAIVLAIGAIIFIVMRKKKHHATPAE